MARRTKNAIGDVADVASDVIRPVASVAADVGRTVAPILGQTLGNTLGSMFGTQGLGNQLAGMLPGGGGQQGQPMGAGGPIIIAGQPIDPKLLYIGGGLVLLVLLTRK
jgi:hypothetical protein